MGPEINPKLAAIVKSSITKKLGEEKMKKVLDSYHRPQNCDDLVSVKTNPEVWAKMRPETRAKDGKVMKIQGNMNKAVTAMVTVADTMLNSQIKGQALPQAKLGECIKTVLDAVTLIGAATQELHMKRRNDIRPDLNTQYIQLNRLTCHQVAVW